MSRTRLLKLVKSLRWKELKSAIRKAPGLRASRDDKGRNLLHLCCSVNVRERGLRAADSVHTANVLLDAGLDINAPAFREGRFRATPLWFAVAFGNNLALARHLLRRGSTPQHCLWAAVNRDNAAVITLLIRRGAHDPTNDEASPLLAAVAWNKPAAAKALLELGADVNYRARDGRTALLLALKKRRDRRFVALLVDHGARGDIADSSGVTVAEIMRRKRDPAYRRLVGRLRMAP